MKLNVSDIKLSLKNQYLEVTVFCLQGSFWSSVPIWQTCDTNLPQVRHFYAHTPTHVQLCTLLYTHARTHTDIDTHTYTHTHTHTHTICIILISATTKGSVLRLSPNLAWNCPLYLTTCSQK